jgi:hypothetical protein
MKKFENSEIMDIFLLMKLPLLLPFVLFVFFSRPFAVGAEWSRLMTKDGIDLFHRDVDGYPYGEFKSVTTVAAPLEEVYGIFSDFTTYEEWYGFCIQSGMLREQSEMEKTIFLLVEAPWPVPNRFIIADVFFESSLNRDTAKIEFLLSEDDYGISVEKSEPMEWVIGECVLERLSPTLTRVSFSIGMDPGGNVPKRLLQLFLKEQMYRTGTGLRAFAEIYRP